MKIQLHTPEGITTIDTDDMTDEELEAFGYHKLHRAKEILRQNPQKITMPEIWELLRIIIVQMGMIPEEEL